MAPHKLLDDDLLTRARELRAAGRSPKEIARALGVRPSTVAPLMRDIAREAAAGEPEPAVTGCWVSQGWSASLAVDGHAEWPASTRRSTLLVGLSASLWRGDTGHGE